MIAIYLADNNHNHTSFNYRLFSFIKQMCSIRLLMGVPCRFIEELNLWKPQERHTEIYRQRYYTIRVKLIISYSEDETNINKMKIYEKIKKYLNINQEKILITQKT